MAPLPPTAKQLRALRRLAEDRGVTFVMPETRRQASSEISRLIRRRRQSDGDRGWEQYLAETARVPADAAAVRRSEITGYGSSAHWAGRA
jgi:hypothetical protein